MEFITLVGNLGADPQTKESAATKFITFPLYVSKYRQGKKSTTVYQIAVFNGRGSFCLHHLKKGTKVLIAGNLDVIRTEGDRTFLNVTAREVSTLRLSSKANVTPNREA